MSSARRRWSAFSSSSAYSATTPRFVSSSSRFRRCSSSCRSRRSLKRAQQFLILLLELFVRELTGGLLVSSCTMLADVRTRDQRRARRQDLAEADVGALVRAGRARSCVLPRDPSAGVRR